MKGTCKEESNWCLEVLQIFPSKHFVNSTCKEESNWWLEVLQIFPRYTPRKRHLQGGDQLVAGGSADLPQVNTS